MANSTARYTLVTLLLLVTPLVIAADQPDFSGAWTTYRGSPVAPTPLSHHNRH